MIFRTAILIAFLGSVAESLSAQSPWTQEQGKGLFQVSFYRIGPYDELYDSGDDTFRPSRSISETTVEAYLEYGLHEDVTLLATVPYRNVRSGTLVDDPSVSGIAPESGSLGALGNVRLGARSKLIGGRFTLSGQLDLDLPSREVERDSGLTSGFDAFTVSPALALGTTSGAWTFAGYAGLGFRTNDFSDFWKIGGSVSYAATDRLQLRAHVDVSQSFNNGDVSLPFSNLQTGLYTNDQEAVALGLGGSYNLTDSIGVHALYYTGVAGNNIPRASFLGAGVYFRW